MSALFSAGSRKFFQNDDPVLQATQLPLLEKTLRCLSSVRWRRCSCLSWARHFVPFTDIRWTSDSIRETHSGRNAVLFIWPKVICCWDHPSQPHADSPAACSAGRISHYGKTLVLRGSLMAGCGTDWGGGDGGAWHGSAQWRSSRQMCFCLGGFPPQEPCPASTLSTTPLCLPVYTFLNGSEEKD